MTENGWKDLVIDAVQRFRDGDASQLDLVAELLAGLDETQQILRDAGYMAAGVTVQEFVRRATDVADWIDGPPAA